jgi:hypothetical protein
MSFNVVTGVTIAAAAMASGSPPHTVGRRGQGEQERRLLHRFRVVEGADYPPERNSSGRGFRSLSGGRRRQLNKMTIMACLDPYVAIR